MKVDSHPFFDSRNHPVFHYFSLGSRLKARGRLIPRFSRAASNFWRGLAHNPRVAASPACVRARCVPRAAARAVPACVGDLAAQGACEARGCALACIGLAAALLKLFRRRRATTRRVTKALARASLSKSFANRAPPWRYGWLRATAQFAAPPKARACPRLRRRPRAASSEDSAWARASGDGARGGVDRRRPSW